MSITPAITRRLTGEIAYRAPNGDVLGRESFDLISHRGGHVLRALCMMDDIGLVRDVSLSMDLEWLPEEGYCRIIGAGRTEAALWFRVVPQGVCVDTSLQGKCEPQQFIPTENRLRYLGLHPLQGDALIVEQRGVDEPGTFRPIETVTNSVSPNGDEAVAGTYMQINAAYIGNEKIEVSAGSFSARRYALRWRQDWPAADLWVREEDNLFLKMHWSMIPTWYELTAWHEERHDS